MRIAVLGLIIASLLTVSPCLADDAAVKDAYNRYYKGDRETALAILESYVQDNPDPAVYYFLGYAYYEMKDMERANRYFTESFRLKDFYSPMAPGKYQ